MTKEEAIAKVKGYLTDLLPSEEYDEVEEIIKSLEQEPCEDAVSRDTFITRYKEWMRIERGKIPNDDTLAIRVIKSLPSVKPQEPKIVPIAEIKFAKDELKELVDKAILTVTPQEPKKGHWKAKSFHELYCDNCGFNFDIMRNDFIDKMKFLP